MRILKIRFRNLNSLAGEWSIDFTDNAYLSNGIFAITGPTGAGKTTILDAMCLALYGATPRLPRINSSSNEIMTRHTGDCFAEISFETNKGSFRCFWSQHRAHKKSEGELQQAKHEIVDAKTDRVLESKIRDVASKVEEVTGMDFDRFTRSMLLAQGGFAAFLQASPDDRAPILEQITGTEIYSRISKKVHERKRDEENELKVIEAELSGISLLSDGEIREGIAQVTEHRAALKESMAILEKYREQKDWRNRIIRLEQNIAELNGSWDSFLKERENKQTDFEKLEGAERAQKINPTFERLTELENQLRQESSEKEQLERTIPLLAKEEVTLKEQKTDHEKTLVIAKNKLDQLQELLKSIRKLDTEIISFEEQKKENEKQYKKTELQLKQQEKKTAELQKKIDDFQLKAISLQQFLDENSYDKNLAEEFGMLEEQFNNLERTAKKRDNQKKEIASLQHEIKSLQTALAKEQNKLKEDQKITDENKEKLQAVEEKINALLESRDRNQLIETLEKDREKLTELKALLHKLEQTKKHEEGIADARKSLEEKEKITVSLKNELHELELKKTELEEKIEGLRKKEELINQIRSLEEKRKRLQSGKPCPLCGSLEHPYVTAEHIPDSDEELLTDARKSLKDLEKSTEKKRIDLINNEKDCIQLEKMIAEYLAEISRIHQEMKSIRTQYDINLDPETPEESLQVVIETMTKQNEFHKKTIKRINSLSDERNVIHHRYELARNDLIECANGIRSLEQRIQSNCENADKAESVLAELESECSEVFHKCQQLCHPYGIENMALDTKDSIKRELKDRKDAYKSQTEQKEKIDKNVATLREEISREKANIEALNKNLKTYEQYNETLQGVLGEKQKLRYDLFQEKVPDDEESLVKKEVSGLEAILQKLSEKNNELNNKLSVQRERLKILLKSVTASQRKIQDTSTAFNELLQKWNFDSQEHYFMARLPDSEIEKLSEMKQQMQQRETELQTLLKEKKHSLKTEVEKQLTASGLEEIIEKSEELTQKIQSLQKEIVRIEQILEQNEAARNKQKEHIEKRDRQKNILNEWATLHEMIGSADGKKFRNFAQGLTFDILIRYANQQLQKLSDRYLMVRDNDSPLELNVIDNYQAGITRSTKNLSGGESFIVSLSLALGLSHMSSRKVRVDSLFLDEGFGTLDEDYLEVALTTLANLHQHGKLIGVISHVSNLKESIPIQITVQSASSGRSTLSGPGCSRLA